MSGKATPSPAKFRLNVGLAPERCQNYKTWDWYRPRCPTRNATSESDRNEGGRFCLKRCSSAGKVKVIEPVILGKALPVMVVPKKDRPLWMCINHRKLNAVYARDTYLLPEMDERNTSLGQAAMFPTLEFNWRYCQVLNADENKNKTTFQSPAGTSRFNNMPLGLMNALANFQRWSDIILNRFECNICFI